MQMTFMSMWQSCFFWLDGTWSIRFWWNLAVICLFPSQIFPGPAMSVKWYLQLCFSVFLSDTKFYPKPQALWEANSFWFSATSLSLSDSKQYSKDALFQKKTKPTHRKLHVVLDFFLILSEPVIRTPPCRGLYAMQQYKNICPSINTHLLLMCVLGPMP